MPSSDRNLTLLYFHGGPGFNSNPERHLLVEPFRKAGFDLKLWDEPSRLRPDGPRFHERESFQNYLNCAENFFLENYRGSPLAIIAHSFGCHPALFLVKKHPDKISKVFAVGPGLVANAADRNILTFTMRDYQEHGDARHEQLREILGKLGDKFDANTEAGFALVAQNPRFLNYYWHDRNRMNAYVQYYCAPFYQLDVESFFSVRRSMFQVVLAGSPVPAVALFGAHDIVISRAHELAALRKIFTHLKVYDLENSAHYPLIEETERSLDILQKELT